MKFELIKKLICTLIFINGLAHANPLELLQRTLPSIAPHISKKQSSTPVQVAALQKLVAASSLFTPMVAENDMAELLHLSDAFEKQPELVDQVLNHMSFAINGQEIRPYQKQVIYVRKDRPYTFSIANDKIGSLVALFKNPASWFAANFKKMLFMGFDISYDCPYENNYVSITDLVIEQQELKPLLDNPTITKVYNFVKEYITWPDGFVLKLKLPQLKKEA